MNYFTGIISALFSEAFSGVANIYDGQLSRKIFFSVWSIVSINGLLLMPFLPLIFFVLHPQTPSKSQMILLIVVSILEFIYQIPYYLALRYAETSVVVLLFNLEKIFVPVLAYLFIGERLTFIQYIGFAFIILCSTAISFKKTSLKLNKAFFYMLFVSLILASDSVLQKYGLKHMEWKTFYFWFLTFSMPFYLIPLLVSLIVRKDIHTFIKSPFTPKYYPLYGQNISTWISGGLETLGLSLLPVTLMSIIDALPGVIVHIILSKGSPGLRIGEEEHFSDKRIILSLFILLGVLLVFYRF